MLLFVRFETRNSFQLQITSQLNTTFQNAFVTKI